MLGVRPRSASLQQIEELGDGRAELAATHWRRAGRNVEAECTGLSLGDEMEAQGAKLRGISSTLTCLPVNGRTTLQRVVHIGQQLRPLT